MDEGKHKLNYQMEKIRIYINGLRFDLDGDRISGKKLCELVLVPVDNASIQNEQGKEILPDENVIVKHGESFSIMRKSI